MTALLRILVSSMYYPSLLFSDVMCALGIWNRWDWVDSGVLLGRVPTRGDIERLRLLGIDSVVNMCAESAGHTTAMAACGMEQMRLPTLDYTCPSDEDLQRGVEFLRAQVLAGKTVYVHCKVGRGRSATLVLCYLMAQRGLSAAEAYEILRATRRQVNRRLARRPAVLALERRFHRDAGGNAPSPPDG